MLKGNSLLESRLVGLAQQAALKMFDYDKLKEAGWDDHSIAMLNLLAKGNYSISLNQEELPVMKPQNEWYKQASLAGDIITIDRLSLSPLRDTHRDLEFYMLKEINSLKQTYLSHLSGDSVIRLLTSVNHYQQLEGKEVLPSTLEDREIQDYYILEISANLQLVVNLESCKDRNGYTKSIFIEEAIVNEDTSTEDLDKLILFIQKYLLF